MEGIDIYRLVGMCAIVVTAWVVQVMGFSAFRTEVRKGPPNMVVVDFEKDFSGEDANRSLLEIGRERGWDAKARLVSASEARMRISEHKRKKWLGLFAGLGGALGVYLAAYKLWGDWLTGIACVLIGPVGLAWGIQRSNRIG